MKAERIRRMIVDFIASGIGAAGMIFQLFFQDSPDFGLILLCLAILLYPGTLAIFSLRSNASDPAESGSATTSSSSQSPPVPPQQPSSSSSPS